MYFMPLNLRRSNAKALFLVLRMWREFGQLLYIRKAFIIRKFLTLRISQIQKLQSWTCATIDAHGMFFINIPISIIILFLFLCGKVLVVVQGGLYKLIGVGSALFVLLQWAMREPRSVERTNGRISTLFLCIYSIVINNLMLNWEIIGALFNLFNL